MYVAALVESAEHVCCRYRVAAFGPHFQAAGHSLVIQSLPKGILGRFRIGAGLGEFDAVILQRRLLSRLEIGLLRARARRLIFDFDDAVWLRDSYAAKGHESRRRGARFRAVASRCDAAVAGNAFLAEEVGRWCPGPVQIIPTCIAPARYVVSEHQLPPGQASLVWIGSSSTLRGLEQIAPLLDRIGRQNPAARLKVVCDRFVRLRDLPVDECRWSETTEAADLAAADIGISWIPDDPWSRGKCGLKVLQYMAAGLPVIANPVGVHPEMVLDGETGFLARTERDWEEAVRALASDPELRVRMGRAGRRRVEECYSVEAGARSWLTLLGGLAQERIPA